jgi:hypothetical protein
MKAYKGEAGFHAEQDPSSGEITVVRTPARDGLENTFTFNNSIELRVSLSLHYGHEYIDSILRKLMELGSADFMISN